MVEYHAFDRRKDVPSKECEQCDDGQMYLGCEVVKEDGETVKELSPGLRCDNCQHIEPG